MLENNWSLCWKLLVLVEQWLVCVTGYRKNVLKRLQMLLPAAWMRIRRIDQQLAG